MYLRNSLERNKLLRKVFNFITSELSIYGIDICFMDLLHSIAQVFDVVTAIKMKKH